MHTWWPKGVVVSLVAVLGCGDDSTGGEGEGSGSGTPQTGGSSAGATDTGDGDGGGTGSGGGSGGSGGSAGSGGSGSTADGSDGGTGGVTPCPDNAAPLVTCFEADQLCELDAICCHCVAFEEPSCGLQWDCAAPAGNDPMCPTTPPQDGSACEDNGLGCQFCDAGGPRFFGCAPEAAGIDPPFIWTEAEMGISCAS